MLFSLYFNCKFLIMYICLTIKFSSFFFKYACTILNIKIMCNNKGKKRYFQSVQQFLCNFIFFENCMKNYKALLQQNILSVTFVISFFHPRIYSCQFFSIFPRAKKIFFSRPFDPLSKVLLFACCAVILLLRDACF